MLPCMVLLRKTLMTVVLWVPVLRTSLIIVVSPPVLSEVAGLLSSRTGQLMTKLWVTPMCRRLLLENADGVRR